MNDQPTPPSDNDLIEAYNRMMARARAALDEAQQHTLPKLQHSIEAAREKAVELGELTREEAERIADYLKRDLEDAGEFLAEPGNELADWLRFDLELIEDRLLELFTSVADRTRVELMELERQARAAPPYHTGEITGPGTLECAACGQHLHFHATGHIPPCPACQGTDFRRAQG